MAHMTDLLAATSQTRITTDQVRLMLRKRYPAPEWAFLEEVAPQTGGGSGYCDAIAVNLWASRGHAINGFEIKAGRGDWLKELKRPAKAEHIFGYCDAWWIVAPKGIVKDGELPPTWGLIEAGPASLRIVRAGAVLTPKPVTLAFFASLIRRAEQNVADRARALVLTELEDAKARNAETIEVRVKERTRQLSTLDASIQAFKAATGLDIDPWGGPPIETIRLAQRLEKLNGYGREKLLGKLAQVADELERTTKTVREALQETVEQPGEPG